MSRNYIFLLVDRPLLEDCSCTLAASSSPTPPRKYAVTHFDACGGKEKCLYISWHVITSQ